MYLKKSDEEKEEKEGETKPSNRGLVKLRERIYVKGRPED